MACLVIDSGDHRGRAFKLTARPLVGGRAPAAEIQVVDAKVSRRHFLVAPLPNGYAIRELRSTNGIWVNEERVAGECVLEDGDRIRVGDTELVFHTNDDPAQRDAVREYRKVSPTLRDRGTAHLTTLAPRRRSRCMVGHSRSVRSRCIAQEACGRTGAPARSCRRSSSQPRW